MAKSTVEQIRRRFDAEVDRFSNLETGQSAAVDSPLAMSLVADAAAATTPRATHVLDVGCGAGNYTLKLLRRLPGLDVTLVDISRPMLDRALERVSAATSGRVQVVQSDVRELNPGGESCDIILAAALLHHLRDDPEWLDVFRMFHRSLRPGGSLWIYDLVESSIPGVQQLMWNRFGEYLVEIQDTAYRDHVFEYIEIEDTPRPLMFQLMLLNQVGFSDVDVLHKNSCFAAFGARKA